MDSATVTYTLNNWSELLEQCQKRYFLPLNQSNLSADLAVCWIDSQIISIPNHPSSRWILRIYPFGFFPNDEYMAVTLVNASATDVYVRYSITLINQHKTTSTHASKKITSEKKKKKVDYKLDGDDEETLKHTYSWKDSLCDSQNDGQREICENNRFDPIYSPNRNEAVGFTYSPKSSPLQSPANREKASNIVFNKAIIRDQTANDIVWRDPEDIALFRGTHHVYDSMPQYQNDHISSIYGEDNEWGSDSFITIEELENESLGYLLNDKMVFHITIDICGHVESNDSLAWAKELSITNSKQDLINIANQDLSTAIQKLSKSVAKQTKNQLLQDKLIANRLVPSENDVKKLSKYEELYENNNHVHIYTSRLGRAAAAVTKTFESSKLIMSLSGSTRHARQLYIRRCGIGKK